MAGKNLPPGENAKYLDIKGWKFKGSRRTKSGHVAHLWFDHISQEEFTQTEAIAWQRKRDDEPELPGVTDDA